VTTFWLSLRRPEPARHKTKTDANAIPRNHGRTLQRQFDQLFVGKILAHLRKDLILQNRVPEEGQLFRTREVKRTLIS
jgi:hypothetical protein